MARHKKKLIEKPKKIKRRAKSKKEVNAAKAVIAREELNRPNIRKSFESKEEQRVRLIIEDSLIKEVIPKTVRRNIFRFNDIIKEQINRIVSEEIKNRITIKKKLIKLKNFKVDEFTKGKYSKYRIAFNSGLFPNYIKVDPYLILERIILKNGKH